MVAAGKFYNVIPSGKTACQSNGTHDRFSSRTDKTHFVNTFKKINDLFGKFCLDCCRRTKTQPFFHGIDHRRFNIAVTMSKDQRSPALHIVNVTIPVDVVEVATLSSFNERRSSLHAAERSYRRIYTSWNDFICLFKCRDALVVCHALILVKYNIADYTTEGLKGEG